MSVTYTTEKFSDLIEEMKALFYEHWQEIANYKDRFPLNPDFNRYRKMDELGLLHTSIAREEEKIIGYCIFFVMPHLHYQDCIYAVNDVVFVSKAHRKGTVGMRIIKFSVGELTKRGVHRMVMHIKVNHDFGRVLERIGFVKTETQYDLLLTQEVSHG